MEGLSEDSNVIPSWVVDHDQRLQEESHTKPKKKRTCALRSSGMAFCLADSLEMSGHCESSSTSRVRGIRVLRECQELKPRLRKLERPMQSDAIPLQSLV